MKRGFAGPLAAGVIPILAIFAAPADAADHMKVGISRLLGYIDTQIAWYRSQNLVKADIKAADIIDTRYAKLIAHP